MKTSESYLPEGSYMVQPAVRQAFSTLGALRQAQDEGRILEAVAQRCTAAHDLLFDLGIAQGILPRVSCALGVAEGRHARDCHPVACRQAHLLRRHRYRREHGPAHGMGCRAPSFSRRRRTGCSIPSVRVT